MMSLLIELLLFISPANHDPIAFTALMEAICKALGACCASSPEALVSLRLYALSPLETDNRVLHLAAKILCAARFVPPNREDLYRSLRRQIGHGMVITFALTDATECVSHVEICRDGTETLRQRARAANPGANDVGALRFQDGVATFPIASRRASSFKKML
jgi:hypothetical protein